MKNLIAQINGLKKTQVKDLVDKKTKEFEKVHNEKSWFSELCFCLLTSNSKAQTAINIQSDLKEDGFMTCSEADLIKSIQKHKHRFHNTKAKRIIEARKYHNIKKTIQKIIADEEEKKKGSGVFAAREWLVKNVKGLGYKESSHFLRNVGYKNVAILDRHIIRGLQEEGHAKEFKGTLNKEKYLEYEKILESYCKKLHLTQSELDMYIWFTRTGKILK